MSISYEVERSLSTIESVLEELRGEQLIENVYGDRIQEAIILIAEIVDKVQELPDIDDIDSVARELRDIRYSVDTIESELGL